MKYIKDIYKEYNPWFDNHGIKLYHVYEFKGIRFKIKYHKMRFPFRSYFEEALDTCKKNGVQHITAIYRD